MKKKIIIAGVVIITIVCVFVSLIAFNLFTRDDVVAYRHFQKVMTAITNSDKEKLEGMFSKHAVEASIDLYGSMDSLFLYIQGKPKPVEKFSPEVDEYSHDGSYRKELLSYYHVDTDEESYIVFVVDCTDDTGDPDNIGIQTIRVMKERDLDPQFFAYDETSIPGIYTP